MPMQSVEREASIVVCSTCRHDADNRENEKGERGGELLYRELEALAGETERSPGHVSLQRMPCLFACSRFCTIHLRAPGKIGYVLGNFTPDRESAEVILAFFRAYRESEEGIVPFREWPEGVKGHFITRMPPEGYVLESG